MDTRPMIQELQSQQDWREAFPVMHELRPHLKEQEYLDLLRSMAQEGYRLFALRDGGRIVSLAGFAVLTSLSYGSHIWVYDLITAGDARSKGYGRRLLEFIEEFARREGCGIVALSSNMARTDAHRFYEEHLNYEKPSYVFRKRLSESQHHAERVADAYEFRHDEA